MKIGKIEIDAIINKDNSSMIDIIKNGEVVRRTKITNWKKQEVYDAKGKGVGLIVEMRLPIAGAFYAFYTEKSCGLRRSLGNVLEAMPITIAKKKQILKSF